MKKRARKSFIVSKANVKVWQNLENKIFLKNFYWKKTFNLFKPIRIPFSIIITAGNNPRILDWVHVMVHHNDDDDENDGAAGLAWQNLCK